MTAVYEDDMFYAVSSFLGQKDWPLFYVFNILVSITAANCDGKHCRSGLSQSPLSFMDKLATMIDPFSNTGNTFLGSSECCVV